MAAILSQPQRIDNIVPSDNWDICKSLSLVDLFNSSSPGQNLQMLFSEAFFVNEKFCILMKISLKFVPKGPVDNNPVLV